MQKRAKKMELSYSAVKVLEKRYLLKDKSGRLIETPLQMLERVAKAVASVERKDKEHYENRFFELMNNKEFLPNSPTLMNAGTKAGNLSACYVLPIEDSIESIFNTLKITALLHQQAAGTGFSFSHLRPRGDIVMSTGGTASGPVSFMEIYDKMTEIMKTGGKRRGANMGVLNVNHPDILEFINAKTISGMLENFNLSVAVSDDFMKAVEKNKSYLLINPTSNKEVKKLNARKVFNQIIENAWKIGDPGLLFIDEINRRNPTRQLGKIEASNPCGEIPLHNWEACNLGSINLAKLVCKKNFDWQKLKLIIPLAIRFLDNVIEISSYPSEQIKQNVKGNRRIGLGVMGFAECLIKLGIPYNSPKALKFADKLMSFIRQESNKASQKLGKEKGNFPNFKKSIWKNKYKSMRNATTTSIAPTGTISIIAECSSGIEPLFAVAFMRNIIGKHFLEINSEFEQTVKKQKLSKSIINKITLSGSIQKIKQIPIKTRKLFVTALDIIPEYHVKMQAVFQKHTDNAVSKTINLPPYSKIKDVYNAYMLAWKLKCKGITAYRYGSKKKQVLTISPKGKLTAEHEFAGGCIGTICQN